MPLLRDGRVVADDWTRLAIDAALPPSGGVVVDLARFMRDRDALLAREAPLGVALANDVDVATLVPDLSRLALVALDFPKFSDGRACSQARLLRERHGFAGEIRATGQVLLDQLLHMRRCGFDAFEMAHPDPEAAWRRAMSAYAAFYQPTGFRAARRTA